eukprot:TRINITY_DN12148_c0_g1_i2.p1 TRINITY_DN12148_c0_g1~~TRINITY_DN12148_c0_g1_i2.p1  ORF type:complete len:408 (-),score=114.41 TRINITY_DN12148_c0_g1_i2:72-1295(-)
MIVVLVFYFSQGEKTVILKANKKIKGLRASERDAKKAKALKEEMAKKVPGRNRNFDQLKQSISKQKKREQTINWRDREMFVDKSRAVAVVLGEKDNKDVLEKRKRSEKRERMKINREIEDDDVELSWRVYYRKAEHSVRRKDIPLAMSEIRNALSAVRKERLNGSYSEESDKMICLKLRAKIFLHANEPSLALEDAKEVFDEFPDDFGAHCMMAECLYMKGYLERSLSVWHKAAKLRPNMEPVYKSIEKVRNTLLVAMTNCFAATDTYDIIQGMLEKYGSVEECMKDLSTHTEYLSDPERKAAAKYGDSKIMSSEEKRDVKNLLGTSYKDKEFLKKVYNTNEIREDVKDVSEEGFLFLVSRAEFWRLQQPLYVKGASTAIQEERSSESESEEQDTADEIEERTKLWF